MNEEIQDDLLLSMKKRVVSLMFIMLKALAVMGVFTIALTCPNMTQMLTAFKTDPDKRRIFPSHANRIAERLRANGCIEIVSLNGLPCYSLTEKGRGLLLRYELKYIIIDKPKKWDKKWRLVIFDVREKRRHCRDAIRRSLSDLGFQRLQDSVWLYPYRCEEVVEMARTAYRVRRDALYLVSQRFGGDEKYMGKFNLPTD